MKRENRKFKVGCLKYPYADKIGSRSSTIARSMASTLMPRIGASEKDYEQMIRLLYEPNANKDQLKCVYCGKRATHLDHLFPLTNNKRPTGYYTEPANLVPCCSSCNQKKGNDIWDVFMNKAETEDKFKYLNEDGKIEERKKRIDKFIKEMHTNKLPISNEFTQQWEIIYDKITKDLEEAQEILTDYLKELQKIIKQKETIP